MKAQLKRIIKWKSENRLIAARIKKIRAKILSGDFDPRDLNELESLAIKKGRNIARLHRTRTVISQRKAYAASEEMLLIEGIKQDRAAIDLWAEIAHKNANELPDGYRTVSDSWGLFTPMRTELKGEWKLFDDPNVQNTLSQGVNKEPQMVTRETEGVCPIIERNTDSDKE